MCGEECSCHGDIEDSDSHTFDWVVENCEHECDNLEDRAPPELDFEDEWPEREVPEVEPDEA
jgi:hypothetical protein